MDPVLIINRIRSDFLKSNNDRDQLNRVIKPYFSVTEPVKNLYLDENGSDLLENIESPPITESYLNNTNYNRRKPFESNGSRIYSRSNNLTETSLNGTRGLSDDIAESVQIKLDPTPTSIGRSRSHSILGDQNSLKHKAFKSLQKRPSDNSLQTVASKASEKSSRSKKSGLKLGRLFRTSSSVNKETSNKGLGRSTSFSKPLFSFYDPKLYANNDIENFEDDEDDDDDKYEYDKGAVLNFFGKEKATNSSVSLEDKLKAGKKSTFLDNFPLNPHNILQLTDSTDSASVSKSSMVHDKNAKKGHENVSSYIESYLNQADLKPLEKVGEFNFNRSSEDVVATDDLSDNQKISGSGPDIVISGGISSVTSNNDDISSYGKSLLDSEFSGDEFQTSTIPPSDYSSMTFSSQDIPNNSIPRSRALTMSHSGDESVLDTELYRATKLLHLAKKSSRESLSHSVPRDFLLNQKRYYSGSQSEFKSQDMKHRGSLSSITESIRSKTPKNIGRHRRLSSNITQESIEKITDSKKSELLVMKKVDFNQPTVVTSKLSALFTKSHSEKLNPLEYFSAVSSEKVLPKDSLKLDAYIQSSRAYRRHPLSISVKKSATVFEVLGYCLYCYTTNCKPETVEGELSLEEAFNPNNFTLKIVDEDGEPFEDNFGILERTQKIGTIFDTEVVICRVDNIEQFEKNEQITPLPYNTSHDNPDVLAQSLGNINQLSYYTSILPTSKPEISDSGSNFVTVKVFLYPNLNPQFNFTTVRISVSSKINDILVQYCKLKNFDPTEYVLKMERKKIILDLNDFVTSLDGNYNLEVLKKKDARSLNFERMKATTNPPGLPTIQSNELTPLTTSGGVYHHTLNDTLAEADPTTETKTLIDKTKHNSKYRLHKGKQSHLGGGSQSFFKIKNSSKSSLGSGNKSPKVSKANELANPLSDAGNYKDILSGAYYKYRVWRRQQMSFISKHERSLVIDGDYVYISGPDGDFNWNHDNFKTKSFHVSQISLVKRSSRVQEYFKIFVMRPDRERRYYFAAVSPEQCLEIVTRLQNLVKVYRMNQK